MPPRSSTEKYYMSYTMPNHHWQADYVKNAKTRTAVLTEICPSRRVGHFKAPC